MLETTKNERAGLLAAVEHRKSEGDTITLGADLVSRFCRDLDTVVAALKQGQREPDGRLVFQVAVVGLPASADSALEVARDLCGRYFGPALWERFGPLCKVALEEDSPHARAVLGADGPKSPGQ